VLLQQRRERRERDAAVGRDELVAFFGSMGWIGGLPE
jgi:hypothetical protein